MMRKNRGRDGGGMKMRNLFIASGRSRRRRDERKDEYRKRKIKGENETEKNE